MEAGDNAETRRDAVERSRAEAFAIDVTGAEVTCRDCGAQSPLADEKAFARDPGSVLRCKHCSSVLGRYRRAQDVIWVDLRASGAWQVLLPH
ncbi:DUF6510 family protein [Nocardioides terrae]|uniref:DUF6510 family protein n=1 Tax=Nocardioides terrae TaxID=574651 RepID=UPI0011136D62|nr:DUF6510 family protein [Nocardioides terrae]